MRSSPAPITSGEIVAVIGRTPVSAAKRDVSSTSFDAPDE
jgi:hypothetical protein